MWLFTQHGFFSAVCARQGDGEYGRPIDPDRIMVRARRREHLERLARRFPDQLSDAEILDSGGTDYPHRIFIAKPVWADMVKQLVVETDYDNFKDAVAERFADQPDVDDYGAALHDVWQLMCGFQGTE